MTPVVLSGPRTSVIRKSLIVAGVQPASTRRSSVGSETKAANQRLKGVVGRTKAARAAFEQRSTSSSSDSPGKKSRGISWKTSRRHYNPDKDLIMSEGGIKSERSNASKRKEKTEARAEVLSHALSRDEIKFYEMNPGCAVLATANRIMRSVSTRQKHGGLAAPPPIVGRIYSELSSGLLAYNNALKMKEVPVPFAYVQYNALLLHFFIIIAPLAVGVYTAQTSDGWMTVGLAAFLAIFVNGAFVALWLVANEVCDRHHCGPRQHAATPPMHAPHHCTRDDMRGIVCPCASISWRTHSETRRTTSR